MKIGDKGKFFLTSDRVRIWYRVVRKGSPTLVFLHGLTGASSAWEGITSRLASGCGILLIDIRGHGLSDKPASEKKYTFRRAARDVKDILAKEGIHHAVLVGHCFGGMVALQVAKDYPSLVDRLVFIDSNCDIGGDAAEQLKLKMVRSVYYALSLLATPLHLEKNKCQPDYTRFSKGGDFDIPRIYNDIRVTSFLPILGFMQEIACFSMSDWLKKTRKDILIIHGKDDLFFSYKAAEKMHSLARNSTLILIDSNHISLIKIPAVIAGHINRYLLHQKK